MNVMTAIQNVENQTRATLIQAINQMSLELGKGEFRDNKHTYSKLISRYDSERAEYERAVRFGTRMTEYFIQDYQKEIEMAGKKGNDKGKAAAAAAAKAKDKGKKTEPVEVAPERRAFEILAEVVWEEKDRPNIAEMTDDQCKMELGEHVSLLTPEDKDTILAVDGGEKAWELFGTMREELAKAAVAEQTPKAEKAGKGKKPEKAGKAAGGEKGKKPEKAGDGEGKPTSAVSQVTKIICENPEADLKTIIAKVEAFGVLVKQTTIQAEYSNVRRCFSALKLINKYPF